MRVIIQRVKEASVSIENQIYNSIRFGLLILVGFEEYDNQEDIIWTAKKITDLRIFSDDEGKMNHSVQDLRGEVLIISQFTLFASTKKGNRPSFIRSAKPEFAIPMYEEFVQKMNELMSNKIKTGIFGADMQIQLINDGPVTIFIDSKNRE